MPHTMNELILRALEASVEEASAASPPCRACDVSACITAPVGTIGSRGTKAKNAVINGSAD